MDTSLLKKTAIQCLALMTAVITFSYSLKQYQTITIQASGQTTHDIENNINFDDPWNQLNINSEMLNNNLSETQPLEIRYEKNVKEKLGYNYLVIKKPEGKNLSLKFDDLYINQSIRISISGVLSNQITDNMITRVRGSQNYVGRPTKPSKKDVNLKAKNGDFCSAINITSAQDHNNLSYTDNILLKLDKVYAYIVYEDKDSYYIDLRKPSEVYDKILVIDAGHGGKDVGASSKNEQYYEKNINLAVIKELKELLDKEKNIKIYYTRTDDSTVYLRPRSTLANNVDCDYFISVHCNANEQTYPNGTEVLYTDHKYKGVKNMDLANLFSNTIANKIPLKKRGIVKKHEDDVYIMDKAQVPMILIEIGYLTNADDMNYIAKQSNRKEIAKGIYDGIIKAYKQLPVK